LSKSDNYVNIFLGNFLLAYVTVNIPLSNDWLMEEELAVKLWVHGFLFVMIIGKQLLHVEQLNILWIWA